MKRIAITAQALCLCLAIGLVSCAGSDSKGAAAKPEVKKEAKTESKEEKAEVKSLNIRYVDGDSIAEHYNLAKDYKDVTIRTLSNIENAQRTKAAELQKQASAIEDKARSNRYTSEAEYNADMQRLTKAQSDAQNYIAGLQQKAQAEDDRMQKQLADSVQSFIKDFAAENGYDAVLYKAAGVYFNPDLDVTDEVVKGLNKRYTKVAK